MLDISKYIVHDLTHDLSDSIAGFDEKPARTLDVDGWNAKTLTIYSHAGTHMDAPFHFGVSYHTIDQFTPNELMCKARIVNVEIHSSKQLIGLHQISEQLDEHKPGDGLIIRTNWSKKLMEPNFKKDLPRISEDLAEWCVGNNVKILGVEPLSVADVENLEEVTKIHNILLSGEVIIVEGLTNLDKIKKNEVFIIALPLKIKNGDGAPARVIAFEEK